MTGPRSQDSHTEQYNEANERRPMNRPATLFCALFVLTGCNIFAQARPPLLIRHVTVIDGTNRPAQPDRTVVIVDNRISAVENGVSVPVPPGAQVVEARGKYLIPGLWDMHVHMRGPRRGSEVDFVKENEAILPLYLANGITGVREMGGDIVDAVMRWRSEVNSGKRLAPRIATCGPKLDGPRPEWLGSIAIATPDQARAAVERVKAMGADFVKVYNEVPNIPRDAYLALLDEAKRLKMPVTGHVPLTLTVEEVSQGGQSIEHFNEYLPGCIRNEKTLKDDLREGRIGGSTYDSAVIRDYSSKTAAALFRNFAANGTWVTPTLTIARTEAFPRENRPRTDFRRMYLSPLWLKSWTDRDDESYGISQTEASQLRSHAKKQYRQSLETIRLMRKAGVSLLAGSDSGVSNASTFPGFSLHDELFDLVEAGLTPLEVLQIATVNAAKWLGRIDTIGTVEPGKLADLVLLDANPLLDIHNIRKVRAVIINGQLLDRARLDKMLAEVEASARN
jgi:imidazolonepropionase-like amidohydrolase